MSERSPMQFLFLFGFSIATFQPNTCEPRIVEPEKSLANGCDGYGAGKQSDTQRLRQFAKLSVPVAKLLLLANSVGEYAQCQPAGVGAAEASRPASCMSPPPREW